MLGKATRLLRRSRPTAVIEEPPALDGPLPPSPPQLIVLVPSVVGIGSFKINTFGDVADAAAFLPTVPQDLQSGVLAFWAMHKQPPLDNTALLECGEALVMLRSPADPQTVYVVTFVNIETAEAFARFEVQRGLALEYVQLYWASLVNIVGTEDGVLIHPSSPPDPDAPPEEAPARREDMKLLEAEIEAELRARREELERELAEEAAEEAAQQAAEQARAAEQAPPVSMDQMQTVESPDGRLVQPLPEDTIDLSPSQGPDALTVTHQPRLDDVAAQAPRTQRVRMPEYEIMDGQAYLEVSPLPEDVLSLHGERLLASIPPGTQPDPRTDARTVLNTIVPVDGAVFLQPQMFTKFAIALTSDQTPETLVVTHQPLLEAVAAEAPRARRVRHPEFEVVDGGRAESPDPQPMSAEGLPTIVVTKQPVRTRRQLPPFEVVDSAPAVKEADVPQVEGASLPPIVVVRQPSLQEVTLQPANGVKVARKAKPAVPAPEPVMVDITALDAATMLAQVFASRRWTQQEKPFRGFDSPPGRF